MSMYKFECPCGAKIETQMPTEPTRYLQIGEIQRCPSCARLWLIGWDYEIVEIVKAAAR